jgi:hypothetical protein
MEDFKFNLKKPAALGGDKEAVTDLGKPDPAEDAADGGADEASEAGVAFAAALKGSDGAAIAETYRRLRDAAV